MADDDVFHDAPEPVGDQDALERLREMVAARRRLDELLEQAAGAAAAAEADPKARAKQRAAALALSTARAAVAAAADAGEYMSALAEQVFADGAPLRVPLGWLRRQEGFDAEPEAPAPEQARRDFARDVLAVDGARSASASADDAAAALVRALRRADAAMPRRVAEAAADALLCGACRTHSGGVALEAVMAALGGRPDVVALTAASELAEPVALDVSVRRVGAHWGLVADCRVSTWFRVVDPSAAASDEDSLAHVRATFCAFLDGLAGTPVAEPAVELELRLPGAELPPPLSRVAAEGDGNDDPDAAADLEPEDDSDLEGMLAGVSSEEGDGEGEGGEGEGEGEGEKPPEPEVDAAIDKPLTTASVVMQTFEWGGGFDNFPLSARSRPTPVVLDGTLSVKRVVMVAACASHAVLLTKLGLVFSYGSGGHGALGHGDLRDCVTPRLVEAFSDAPEPLQVVHVSCGADAVGSMSAAVTTEGALFTWGSGVALGQPDMKPRSVPSRVQALAARRVQLAACGGRFAVCATTSGEVFSWGKTANGRLGRGKHALHVAMLPRRVGGRLKGRQVVQLACGTAHTLAVDAEGRLFAWGHGFNGQLGTGRRSDALKPREVGLGDGVAARRVACGSLHSLVLDAEGGVWSFGGDGEACLGHGDYLRRQVQARNEMLQQLRGRAARLWREAERQAAPRLAAMPWLLPRRVAALETRDCAVVAAGGSQSAVVTAAGELFTWGVFVNEGGDAVVRGAPTLLTPAVSRCAASFVEAVAVTPRHTVAVTGSDLLGRALYRELLSNEGDGEATADVVLIVAGRRLRAHKPVLACRSPVLRDMILEEERPGQRAAPELLLPGLRYEVALVLLEYLYSDTVTAELDAATPLPGDLLAAAKQFRLPRLQHLCESVLVTPEAEDESGYVELQRSRLASDIRLLCGDRRWADVVFLASGKPLYAHRCVLEARSFYFAAMFRSGMREASMAEVCLGPVPGGRVRRDPTPNTTTTQQHPDTTLVVVPDSHVALSRVLTFVYSNHVEPASLEVILDDLVAADRYGLERMKALCEAMVDVTPETCVRVLETAAAVHASALFERAMLFALENLDSVAGVPGMARRNPALLGELAARLRALAEEQELPEVPDLEEPDVLALSGDFPWRALLATGALLALYYVLLQTWDGMAALTPVVNFAAVAGFLGAGFRGLAVSPGQSGRAKVE